VGVPQEHTSADLKLLLGSWELSLRAERKSEQTLKSYGDGVRAYLRWAEVNDLEATCSRPLPGRFSVAT
jgi:hypothetical protein